MSAAQCLSIGAESRFSRPGTESGRMALREPNPESWGTPGFIPVGQNSLNHSGNPPRTGKHHMDVDRSSCGRAAGTAPRAGEVALAPGGHLCSGLEVGQGKESALCSEEAAVSLGCCCWCATVWKCNELFFSSATLTGTQTHRESSCKGQMEAGKFAGASSHSPLPSPPIPGK